MNIISSKDLKYSDIPDVFDLKVFDDFALTFDIKELESSQLHKISLGYKDFEDYSLSELRAFLYVEQRRWNHFGRFPDEKSVKFMCDIVKRIKKILIP